MMYPDVDADITTACQSGYLLSQGRVAGLTEVEG